jgi:hypothetical protein
MNVVHLAIPLRPAADRAMPACVTALCAGLTHLDLRHNSLLHLPDMSQLKLLQRLELFGSPATNVAAALQGCRALRRLGLGTRHFARCRLQDASAYDDVEACMWQDGWLRSVRSELPWVPEVGATYAARYS